MLEALQAKFSEHESSFEVAASSAAPGLITFERWTEAVYDSNKKAFIPLPRREHAWKLESVVLLVVKGAAIADRVARGTLSDWYGENLARVRAHHPSIDQVFLVLHDLKGYYAKLKRERDKAFAARARAAAEGRQVTIDETPGGAERDEVEMELLRLQMKEKCWQIQSKSLGGRRERFSALTAVRVQSTTRRKWKSGCGTSPPIWPSSR